MSTNKINYPSVGINFSLDSTVKPGEYSMLFNGNVQSVSNTLRKITNEQSNVLCSRFKPGFKVINANYVPSLNFTFFFLTNPETKESEIGYITNSINRDTYDKQANCESCGNNPVVEDTPLEEQVEYESCDYITFVNSDCLNFNIDFPIQSWVKVDDCNIRIFFNDKLNDLRYIDYKDYQKVTTVGCPRIEIPELDCDKIKLFPQSCYPVLDSVDVVPGGQNTAGVYQFAIAYSDVLANNVTDYFYVTNPLPLYSKAIIDNARTDYPVAKSIKLQILNLNTDFNYFNLVVLKTINNVTTPYLVETFQINSSRFEYIYSGVEKNIQQNLSIDEILKESPFYRTAKGLTASNGYLFHYNLDEDRVLNLQPVVNKIPVKWQTVELNDGDYANPIIAQNYVGYLGDEVYPFGIAFTKTNGKHTNVFPFIGRETTTNDLQVVNNSDVISVSSCDPTVRDLMWQVYNTASVIGTPICPSSPSGTGQIQTNVVTVDCYSDTFIIQTQSVNSSTGEVTQLTSPVLYNFPPTGTMTPADQYGPPRPIVYPPTTTQQSIDLVLYWLVNANEVNQSAFNDPNSTIVCNCDDFIQAYIDSGATNVSVLSSNINWDLSQSENSVEQSVSDYVFQQNTYSPSNIPTPPNPSPYPNTPSPCMKDEYEDWLDLKDNWSPSSATLIVQSSTNTCAMDVWGAFLKNTSPEPGENAYDSWYSFYCTNVDGVAVVMLSTASDYQSNHYVYTLEVFEVDSAGNPIYPPISTGSYAGPQSVSLTNLVQGKQYMVRVNGSHPNPVASDMRDQNCKTTSFKICVVSPKPVSIDYEIIPGQGRIRKECTIQYDGVPPNSCIAVPQKYGDFAYWESLETYPCNEEVWGELAGKPIRHFKFPDNLVSPFFSEQGSYINGVSTKSNKIYPKGIRIDVGDIKAALELAVGKGLITQEEKSQICGYRIYRGNRRGNQSIIAKGLLYDVWKYKDNIYNTGQDILFSNFPFNDNSPNYYLSRKKISNKNTKDSPPYLQHPNHGAFNNDKYTFDAPNLSFNNPGLGTELRLEGEQVGKSTGSMIDLKNNTQYQYVGGGIISAAVGFASVEAAFEALQVMASATMTLPITVLGSGTAIPLGMILAIVGENILSPIRIYSHYAEWYDIIKKFAPYRNYAVYYAGVGKYISNEQGAVNVDPLGAGMSRRQISNTQYVNPGILNVNTTRGAQRFNNFNRDSSVFIEIDGNFSPTLNIDTSRSKRPDCNFKEYEGDVSSFYASMKNTLVSQYGQIDNIEWIDTGYNGRIDWSNPNQDTTCDTIFGGDTYINRFTKKRKTPLFLEDRVITSTTQSNTFNQDVQMSQLNNIAYPVYWMDYPTSLDFNNTVNALFGDVAVQNSDRCDFNFICKGSDGGSWKDAGLASAIAGSFAGVSFGVISLPITVGILMGVTQAELGDDLFLKGKYVHSFYGVTSFLCESDYNLDLRHGENYREKDFYPHVGDVNEWTQQWNVPISEDNYFLYNIDYSKQNKENPNYILNIDFSQEKSDCKVSHPNRVIYSLQDNDNNDTFDGNLVYLSNNYYDFPKSRGKLQILKGLQSGRVLAVQENGTSVYNSFISQESNIGISTVGSNSLFNRNLPTLYVETELGWGGSQTQAFVQCEFGSFWVDNLRGQVLNYTESLQDLVKPEQSWWFKENLPFRILEDFPNYDITNNYKYIGTVITYDSKFKRIFFTKRDLRLKEQYRGAIYNGQYFITTEGKTFTEESKEHFYNVSWTIAYSPIEKNFISFYSFTPNYYVANQQYFSSGMNYSLDDSNIGFYNHLLTNKSYQVFYGKKRTFLFDFNLESNSQNQILESIQYLSEFRRFQNNNSFAIIKQKTFNKALIYNQNQTSGILNLIPHDKNDWSQLILNGQLTQNGLTILTENVENYWRFNYFYNIALENGNPVMSYDFENVVYKTPNPDGISYNQPFLPDVLRSDYFTIRLENDKYTNYQILTRFTISQETPSIS